MENDAFTRWGWKACLDCGDSIAPETEHSCDPERAKTWMENMVLAGVALLERDLADFLATPQGAFADYYAAHSR